MNSLPCVVRKIETVFPPWPHQADGLDLIDEQVGTMLAYDMGTGKTKIVIDAINNLPGMDYILIVCPNTVMEVWRKEFLKHSVTCPQVVILSGTIKQRMLDFTAAGIRKRDGVPLVFVINYESVWRAPLSHAFKTTVWSMIVCDEIHRIKSPGGKTSRFMGQLKRMALKRVGLTGTPFPHSPLDAYAQYRFLDPSVFGYSFTLHRARYALMGGYQGKQVMGFVNMEEFHEKFYSIAKRVTKAEVLPDLPDQVHEICEITLNAPAQRAHDEVMRDLFAEFKGGYITAANALVKFLRLQQITGGTIEVQDIDGNKKSTDIDNSKYGALVELFDSLPSSEPVVVFAKFRADLDKIKDAAIRCRRPVKELSGRCKELEEWQESDDGDVLAVQIQAGGVGIDLTRASYGVYYSTGFSLGDYQQSLARLHRPGQKNAVTYIHLIARGTIDEYVFKALEKREQIVESVLSQIGDKA